MHSHKKADAKMAGCIEQCLKCYTVCAETLSQHCLEAGGKHTKPDHVRLMMDCAEICRTSADFLIRGSKNHHLTCGVCADICRQCADNCDSVGEMDSCAAACRACAVACEAMSGITA